MVGSAWDGRKRAGPPPLRSADGTGGKVRLSTLSLRSGRGSAQAACSHSNPNALAM